MPERISVAACERLTNIAQIKAASAVPVQPAPPPSPNFDTLAISLSHQNNLMAEIALLIGVVGLLALIGWGLFVKNWAERTAKDTAREWMERNAGDLIAKFAPPVQFPEPDPGGARALSPSEQAEELETEGDQP